MCIVRAVNAFFFTNSGSFKTKDSGGFKVYHIDDLQ